MVADFNGMRYLVEVARRLGGVVTLLTVASGTGGVGALTRGCLLLICSVDLDARLDSVGVVGLATWLVVGLQQGKLAHLTPVYHFHS